MQFKEQFYYITTDLGNEYLNSKDIIELHYHILIILDENIATSYFVEMALNDIEYILSEERVVEILSELVASGYVERFIINLDILSRIKKLQTII